MKEGFYTGAYWGPRKETALECAQRAKRFFHQLALCEPTFDQWYRGGQRPPRGTPGFPVHQEAEEWEQLFLRGVNRTDVGSNVIERLGFMVSVWNAQKDRTRVEIHCGGYSTGVSNLCLLEPPEEGPVHERLWREPVLTRVLTSMVSAWDPDFAMAGSSEMVSLLEKQGERAVRIGWLTYLSRRLGRLPPLPAPVRIEPVGEQGWLLLLSPEPMSAHVPEHVALTARVRELLDRAGLIALPTPDDLQA